MTAAHRPGCIRSASAGRTAWRRGGPPARGFTLIEVLVAVAVVAVALGAGLKAAGALTDNTQRLIDVTAAQWCADNYLTELRLTRQFPGIGDGEFACSQLGRQYRGTLEVRPTPNPNFRRVDARIADERGQPMLTLSTVLPRY
jgi:general secretion pathway protein I